MEMTKTKALFTLLAAVIANCIVGGLIAYVVFGASPVWGAAIANLIMAALGAVAPKDAARAGVLTEIWTGEMIKAFRTPKEHKGWYDRIRPYDQYVNNDVIHFTELGGDPNVLVNNTTYPINITTLTDADKPVSLDRFDTEATAVTDDELHACSYDKMASVQQRHREALEEAMLQKAIHSIAPDSNAANTPVIRTTGAADGGRKKMCFADILAIKRKFDKFKVPLKDRVLVLSSEHVNDLLETEQKFKEHYNINQTEGVIARLYGFDVYEYGNTPFYSSALNKVNFGATLPSGALQASVAFHAGSMMKANGSLQFYHSDANQDPQYHRNLVNFRMWNICLPLKSAKTRVAIVSGQASA